MPLFVGFKSCVQCGGNMRRYMAVIYSGVWSCLGFAAALNAQTQSVTIDYTGSLYGYYRMEPHEPTPLPPVDRFLKARALQPNTLLVGMGDNFGPEFGAALQMEDATDKDCALPPTDRKNGETRPETLYKDDNRVPRAAMCDNVLNFMMHAGYRALVPGREDFMYTSRWLRVSALLLKQAKDATEDGDPNHPRIKNPDRALYLLGANLRIQAAKGESEPDSAKGGATKTNPYALKGRCPLLFADDPFGANSTPCFPGGQPETLEYLERLDRLEANHGENSAVKALEALAVRSATDRISLVQDQVNIFVTSWGSMKLVKELRALYAPFPKNMGGDGHSLSPIDEKVEALKSLNTTCESPKTSEEQDMCIYQKELFSSLITLRTSLTTPSSQSQVKFVLSDPSREAAIRALLSNIALEQLNVGYTLTEKGGSRVLVIGVAGTETMNAISQTNLDLCPGSAQAGTQSDYFVSCDGVDHPKASVTITDPVAIVSAIVRGVRLKQPHLDGVVVLAQMTHTEAEVLSARVARQLRSTNMPEDVHPVDVVLSEAEEAYSTPTVTLNYDLSVTPQTARPAPVFTPLKSYSSNNLNSAGRVSFPGTVYEARVNSVPKASYSISNSVAVSSDLPPGERDKVTIVSCLIRLVSQLKDSPDANPANCLDGTGPLADLPENNPVTWRDSASRDELLLFEMLQKAVTPRADVVLLESRDLQLDFINPAYTNYDKACEGEKADRDQPYRPQLCRLRIALDRIFWKGDYLEYVAVKGADLKSMIELSNKKMDDRTELVDRDITGEWLVTFGIVQSALTNVTQVSRNEEPLWIPADSNCKGPSPQQSVYCVGGSPLVDDQYYWVLTSDHLAQDAVVYGTLQKLPRVEHVTIRKFLTMPLAHYALKSIDNPKTQPDVMPVAGKCPSVECDVTTRNAYLQQQPLWQMDFLKVVGNFTSRSPVGGNQFVGSYFQGVSDSRASAPSTQELDLEFANRITGDVLGTLSQKKTPTQLKDPSRFSEGIQTSFAYDRSVVGNLSPATKSINASYALNNLTVGGFVQMRLGGKQEPGLPRSVRSLPRTLLVLTPYQYQIQVNHQYLFFPFAASSPLPGELTATLPRNTSWTDRVGIRHEFGPSGWLGSGGKHPVFTTGSYFEAGGEYVVQNSVLSGITLANGTTQKTCLVNANITLQTCFSQPPAFTITSNTKLIQPILVKDLHSPGIYWNFHLQSKVFGKADKQVSLVTDTQGDFYFGRGASAELPTQTEYAIPLTISLNFPAFGNLSFAPAYSGFFYKSQLSTQSLQVNSFSIMAKWYLARDNRVPLVRQSKLPGPQSSDQTKSAKTH